jgi:POT family proton-dependent oligopeptide transporter
MGELWVVPIGLSKISQHSPARLESVMMGFWTMAIAYGHYFAGIIAQFSVAAAPENSLSQYQAFFFCLGSTALAIGVTVLLIQMMRRGVKVQASNS